MRTAILAGAALGIVTLIATPALACTTPLTARSCAATGGTYSARGQVHSCTTATDAQQTSATYDLPLQTIAQNGLVVRYTGTAYDVSTVRTTITRTQRGNGPITSTTTPVVVSSQRVVLTCVVDADFLGVQATRSVPPDVCVNPQNYPVTALFS